MMVWVSAWFLSRISLCWADTLLLISILVGYKRNLAVPSSFRCTCVVELRDIAYNVL